MKISYDWLRKYINTSVSIEEVSSYLTDTGLEVEGVEEIESVKGGLKGVVVGLVKECSKHPDADKLKLTKVDIGAGEILDIVCGAPNVAEGQKVAVATIGTKLYSENGEEFEIKKSKIRGALSMGMLCAEDELGLGESHDGIIVLDDAVKIGTPLSEVYNVSSDYCIEIGLTPNRTDAMFHYGVARDLHASLKTKKIQSELSKIEIPTIKVGAKDGGISVKVEDEKLCPRYTGAMIEGVKVQDSPEWLQKLLKTIGLRSINNIVDITNYIMHSYGQPLHAFDANKIAGGGIVVGTAKKGEDFITLDGEKRKINGTEIFIKDAKGTPLCMAGVMGGLDSGVSENTTKIFLESAYFDAVAIRKGAKLHGINTDSSFRNERGIDPSTTFDFLCKAIELIKEIAGGEVVGELIDVYPNEIVPTQFPLRYNKVDQILGNRIHRELIKEILEALDFKILSETDLLLELEVPLYRVDVTREIDVIEEIARIYGFNNIEASEKFTFAYSKGQGINIGRVENMVSDTLKSNGFYEVMNNSLTKKRGEEKYVELLNPLSNDLCVMRTSLVYGMLGNIAFNVNRQQRQIKFFEFGKTYFKYENYVENKKLALALYGNYTGDNWIGGEDKATFFHLKGIVKQLLINLGLDNIAEGALSKDAIFSEGIEIKYKKSVIVKLGIVDKKVQKEFDIKGDVFYAELDWDKIIVIQSEDKEEKLKDIPKFLGVRRDLALLLNSEVQYIDLYKTVFDAEKNLLKEVNLFDVYEGKNLPEGKKSYALSFYLQNEEKTLVDKDIDKVMLKLTEKFEKDFSAELRN